MVAHRHASAECLAVDDKAPAVSRVWSRERHLRVSTSNKDRRERRAGFRGARNFLCRRLFARIFKRILHGARFCKVRHRLLEEAQLLAGIRAIREASQACQRAFVRISVCPREERALDGPRAGWNMLCAREARCLLHLLRRSLWPVGIHEALALCDAGLNAGCALLRAAALFLHAAHQSHAEFTLDEVAMHRSERQLELREDGP